MSFLLIIIVELIFLASKSSGEKKLFIFENNSILANEHLQVWKNIFLVDKLMING